jgi:hypothetical protein
MTSEKFTQDDVMIVLVGKGSSAAETTATNIGTKANLAQLLSQNNAALHHLVLPRNFAEKVEGHKTRNHQAVVLAVRRPNLVKLTEELASLDILIKWQTAANAKQMAVLRELDNNNQEEEEEEEEKEEEEGRLVEKTMLLLVEGSEAALENIETELRLKVPDPDGSLVAGLRAMT